MTSENGREGWKREAKISKIEGFLGISEAVSGETEGFSGVSSDGVQRNNNCDGGGSGENNGDGETAVTVVGGQGSDRTCKGIFLLCVPGVPILCDIVKLRYTQPILKDTKKRYSFTF